jgi:hypothetical protein
MDMTRIFRSRPMTAAVIVASLAATWIVGGAPVWQSF